MPASAACQMPAHHRDLTSMTARRLNYWDYDRRATVTCPDCGWSGRCADHENAFSELLDVRCGACDRMLLIVRFPTDEETRAAAAAGNAEAQAEMRAVDIRQARQVKADLHQLREPHELPDLPGGDLRIEWDFEERDEDVWTVLRHDGAEIWREVAFYEGYERFAEVFEIVRQRYGGRFAELRPTPESEMYLYGDRLSAPRTIDALNATLRPGRAST
jgi:hypothetical protein